MRNALVAAAVIVVGAVAWRAYSARAQEEDVGTAEQAPDLLNSLEELVSSGDDVSPLEPNVAAFLSMIRSAEGTATPEGYRALFGYLPSRGGPLFDDFSDHPRVKTYGEFVRPGETTFTTAAGAYQITMTTFDRMRAKISVPDFSPASQDRIALELIREKSGALDDVRAGRFDIAVTKVNKVWASLPGGGYNQRTRTPEFISQAYEAAGGTYA